MTEILRAGVIGAGVFGGYHAAKYTTLPGVALTAVYDTHPDRAAALAAKHGAQAVESLQALFEKVDVASITAPARDHGALGLAALKAGKAVYIEKPLAAAGSEADAILAEAHRRRLVVATGFLERAAFAALGLFDVPVPPVRLEATRLGLPSSRNLDVSVVMDLMIHDLDLALALAKAPAFAVEAEGARLDNTSLDEVRAEVAFENGLVAVCRASRVSTHRERTLRLIYPDGEVRLDLLSGDFANTTPYRLDPDFEQTPAGRDRLGASLSAFLACVRGEVGRPLADGRDGAFALDLALAVEQAVDAG
jgi:predicted dehydrogenase